MSSSRRNRPSRRQTPAARQEGAPRGQQRAPSAKPAWRQAIDQWGGLPVLAAIVIVPVVVVAMIVVGGRSSEPSGTPRSGEFVPKERPVVDGRVEGSADAPVKIVEYADFSCPHCREFQEGAYDQFLTEFVDTGLASLEYKYVAFLGPGSERAAQAAECANQQGYFWDMHDLLFLRQASGAFSADNLKGYGQEIHNLKNGFDTGKYNSCVDSEATKDVVQADVDEGGKKGVNSTPTFFVNGQQVTGNQTIEQMRQVVNRALGR